MSDRQNLLDSYFNENASYWKSVYGRADPAARILQLRRDRCLEWVRELRLAPGAEILDAGCGAGLTAIPLAQSGYSVHAVDHAPAMLELTRKAAQRAGVAPSLSVSSADARSLAGFGENQFHLVISLGVIAWLERPERAISATWRVLRPGGHLILSVGNRFCLHDLLDPRRNQLLAPARRKVATVLRRMGWLATPVGVSSVRSPEDHHLAPWKVDRMLATANFYTEKGTTVGFGPFTLLRRKLFPDPVSERLDRVLQGLADRNLVFLRSAGAHYLVLAKKPF